MLLFQYIFCLDSFHCVKSHQRPHICQTIISPGAIRLRDMINLSTNRFKQWMNPEDFTFS
jgi:hypothetical protein